MTLQLSSFLGASSAEYRSSFLKRTLNGGNRIKKISQPIRGTENENREANENILAL